MDPNVAAAAETWKKWFPQFTGLPKWAWLFVGACLLVPVLTMGGAVPAVTGILGATACAKAAKASWPAALRIAVCALLAAATWVATFALLAVLSEVMNRRN
jgi:hypothetical protein